MRRTYTRTPLPQATSTKPGKVDGELVVVVEEEEEEKKAENAEEKEKR